MLQFICIWKIWSQLCHQTTSKTKMSHVVSKRIRLSNRKISIESIRNSQLPTPCKMQLNQHWDPPQLHQNFRCKATDCPRAFNTRKYVENLRRRMLQTVLKIKITSELKASKYLIREIAQRPILISKQSLKVNIVRTAFLPEFYLNLTYKL